MHQNAETLQPIMSHYQGEVTSRSGRNSPQKERIEALLAGDRSRESPLRSARKQPTAPLNQNPQGPPRASTSCERSQPMEERTVPDNTNSFMEDDSKLDRQAFMMGHTSTQKSHSAYGAHKSSINESSIHNKLSALRNVFSQIR